MKNIQSIWFAPLGLLGSIGLVMGTDQETGKRKAYIGIGYGINKHTDELLIAQNGAKFPAEMAQRIADWLNEEQPVNGGTDGKQT